LPAVGANALKAVENTPLEGPNGGSEKSAATMPAKIGAIRLGRNVKDLTGLAAVRPSLAPERTKTSATHRLHPKSMSFKTTSISTTVYRHLRSRKQAGESFTDVIARLLSHQQPPLSRHAGAWKPMPKSEIADVVRRVDELRHHGKQKRALR